MKKKFTVEGRYHGKVKLTVWADTLEQAIDMLDNADEDEIEVLEPSKVIFDSDEVRQT